MSRIEFFRRLGRYLLLLLIAVITFILGNKVISVTDCTSCPGNGICRGESDCSNFLSEAR